MSIGNSENIEELYVLFLLFLSGRLGRRQISKILDIGEGRIKRIIKNLCEKNLVDVKRAGVALNKNGLDYLFDCLTSVGVNAVGRFDVEELCAACIGVGFQFSNLIPSNVLEVRDEAVRGGAKGALIVHVVDGKWLLPPEAGDLRGYCPFLVEELDEAFRVKSGDTILLVFAEDLGRAIIGGLKAALLASSLFKSSIID